MIRVLIADDDALVRAGLTMILESAVDITVVGEAGDGAAAIDRAKLLKPDVILMDIRMPRMDGIAATQQIMSELDPRPSVLVLTTFHLDEYVFGALEAGASGFALKDLPGRDLIEAVRTVHRGDAILSPADTRSMIERYARPDEVKRKQNALAAMERLSPREREVADAVSLGLSNSEIAAKLYCSETTVKAHLTHIFSKLGIDNRVQVAILSHDARV